MIDFATLTPPSSPNYYLVCPKGYCKSKPDAISPVFDVSVTELYQSWQKMIAKQPRTKLVAQHQSDWQFTYVQRSFLFRFQDFITVTFIRINAKQSTLAVYSRSKTGYYDFGVNRRRVKSWLSKLPKHISN